MPEGSTGSLLGVARNISALRARVDAWRQDRQKVALVPTMGALHDGHISLIKHARRQADRVVASIFVNPAQFAPHEDFDAYPRRTDEDLKALSEAGCDLAYIPDAKVMYPPGFQTSVAVGALSTSLCGISRPHFFGGVATVVCKLLNQARPDMAVFGEKDFQQLLIIKRMVADLDMPVQIIGAPIVREADGLALSSRNAYLSAEQRAVAPALQRAIAQAAREIVDGAAIDAALAQAQAAIIDGGFDAVDYLEARSAVDLTPATIFSADQPLRIFAAASLGRTRLIDNVAVDAA